MLVCCSLKLRQLASYYADVQCNTVSYFQINDRLRNVILTSFFNCLNRYAHACVYIMYMIISVHVISIKNFTFEKDGLMIRQQHFISGNLDYFKS